MRLFSQYGFTHKKKIRCIAYFHEKRTVFWMEVLEGIVGQLKIIKKAQFVRYRSLPLVLETRLPC